MVGYVLCNHFRLFEDTDTDLVGGQSILPKIIFSFYIQSNHLNYIILLLSTDELPELYILTDPGIKTGNSPLETGKPSRKKKCLYCVTPLIPIFI